MDDKTLNKMLDSHVPPARVSNLSSRILIASETASLSQSPISKPFTKRFMPIAASLLAVSLIGYTFFTPSQNGQTETEIWQEAALDLGFNEVYTWVESEE